MDKSLIKKKQLNKNDSNLVALMSYAKVAFISGYKSHATELPNASLFEA